MRAFALRGLVLGFCLVAIAGCAQRASFRQQRPAKLDFGMRRLAVLDVSPPRDEHRGAGEVVESRLRESGMFWVADARQMYEAAPAPLVYQDGTANIPAALEAGRRIGLDGLLVTQVRFVEPDGETYGFKAVRFGDPKVAAALRYELIEVRSGSVLDRNEIRSAYVPLTSDGVASRPNSEATTLSRLSLESGGKLADLFTPHEVDIEVTLAHASMGPGAGAVREGMQAAKDGDWQLARQHWLSAVEADPKNDAAQYNLGLAHEALGELVPARRAFETALAANFKNDYQQALDRVQRAESDMRLASFQRFGGNAPPQPQVGRRSDFRPPGGG